MNEFDISELRDLIDYDPSTGSLVWKVRVSNAVRAGTPALSAMKSSGHKSGIVKGVPLQAHRVAWAIHHGEWPDGFIDHINGVRDDNRIENLRVVSSSGNAKNRRPNEGKLSGLPHGVSLKNNGRYFAQIQIGGKNHHLGYFDSTAAAKAAYDGAKRRYKFHENHGIKALIANLEAE